MTEERTNPTKAGQEMVFRFGGTPVVQRTARLMVVVAFASIAVCLGVAVAVAQGLPPAPQEMEALGWLEGEWKGTGWMEYGPGRRAEFEGTESVAYRMGGRVLVVEGSFTAWMGPEAGDVPVHRALGVISWDRSDRYLFHTWTAAGASGNAHPMEVSDGQMVWTYDDPGRGRARYTITYTDAGAWHEVGDASDDGGESWHRFFEMTLEQTRGG